MNVLDVQNLSVRFGGLTAVNDVSFSVQQNQIFSIIGPNGAGKTTLFNAITGVYKPSTGSVRVRGVLTARQLSGDMLRAVAASAVTALGFFLAVNCQSLWDASINSLYVYQEPFSYRAAFHGFLAKSAELSLFSSLLPAVMGAGLGFWGTRIARCRACYGPEVVAGLGVSRTFQNIRLFPQMTVLENVLVGMHRKMSTNLVDAVFRTRRFRLELERAEEKARKLLEVMELADRADWLASALPYGHQRRLEIARALASDPVLLLLDEPAAGTNPTESEELMELIRKIRDRGVTILLIEHHMKLVMGISDRVVVVDYGNKIAEGTPAEVRANPKVIEAYLGTGSAVACG